MVKQKGDGDEREIAFLLPPREGEAPVKARKRKIAKNVEESRQRPRAQDCFQIFSSVVSGEPREAREEEKTETI